MNTTEYAIAIESPVFDTLRGNLNALLKSTVSDMLKKDVKQSKITTTLEITLEDSSTADLEEHRYAAERDIIVPSFKHKIVSQMNVKETSKGFASGEGFELTIDKSTGKYVMKALDQAQTSLFDDSVSREGFLEDDVDTEDFEDDELVEIPDDEEA